MNNILIEPATDTWAKISQRPQPENSSHEKIVADILADVKEFGDEALKKYSLKFDGYPGDNILVTQDEIDEGALEISAGFKEAILLAKNNIEKFHAVQVPKKIKKVKIAAGVSCWRKNIPIENVGLYIPGGTAPLFSTFLMLGIPALLAGCKNIIVCTPPGANGKLDPSILFVSKLLGIGNMYKAGGAQAIAAMAYGTESITKVDKIFGPGNNFVTYAKKLVSVEGTSIDMLAGPSEVAIYADETCNPVFVAADLLSQAEHGVDSQVILVARNIDIIENVVLELSRQLVNLSRKAIINKSLSHSRLLSIEEPKTAFDFLNFYAPEHLIIASKHAKKLSAHVTNAGSVFLGNYSAESSGDYASGTNHSLPTGGTAKTQGGVSVDSFVKKITFQKISRKGIKQIGPSVEIMAAAEGLDAHKNAVNVRIKASDNENI